jgi:HSP20 family protein
MANIVRKPENQPAQLAEWDPFRVMRNWLRWDPFGEMQPYMGQLEQRMPEMLAQFEVKETKEGYVFKADVPGVKDEDIDITLAGNRLTISGKRQAEKTEETDTFYAYERSYGAFSRSFTTPEGVDIEHIRTELKAGVLTVVLPKRPEVQPRRIDVKSVEKSKS